jgi:SNF family Na+-dependent transporter
MAFASKLGGQNLGSLATIAFYGLSGIVFLVMLALSGFPPHIALMGITSIVAAYGLFTNRKWAKWLVVALLFVATTFALYTLYYVMATDAITSVGMIVYAVLTWVFTIYVVKLRKTEK